MSEKIERHLIRKHYKSLRKPMSSSERPIKILPTVQEWALVSFPIELAEEVYKIEDELSDKGITFDAGAGFGKRDWQLDWSLSGATAEQVIKYLREKHPKLYPFAEIITQEPSDDDET